VRRIPPLSVFGFHCDFASWRLCVNSRFSPIGIRLVGWLSAFYADLNSKRLLTPHGCIVGCSEYLCDPVPAWFALFPLRPSEIRVHLCSPTSRVPIPNRDCSNSSVVALVQIFRLASFRGVLWSWSPLSIRVHSCPFVVSTWLRSESGFSKLREVIPNRATAFYGRASRADRRNKTLQRFRELRALGGCGSALVRLKLGAVFVGAKERQAEPPDLGSLSPHRLPSN
jgi:hypothetical protein